MGCCLCRDEFEQQRKVCSEIENELEYAIKKFHEFDLEYEEKKWYFNKIRKCNEDIEKNVKKLEDIFKREEQNYIKNGEIRLRIKQLEECISLSKIKNLKVSKIFLNYYTNFNKPSTLIDIGLKRKTI